MKHQNRSIIAGFNHHSADRRHGGKIVYNQSFQSNMNSAFRDYAQTLLQQRKAPKNDKTLKNNPFKR